MRRAGPYEDFRWSRFRHFAPADMFDRRRRARVPVPADARRRRLHLRAPHEGRAVHDPDAGLLAKVVVLLAAVPMEERDTKGDIYEYMLGKIAAAGQNGQFRTPRHIIRLMVELTAPQPADVICDPACGTAGFLVAAGEYLRERHPNLLHDAKLRQHFHHQMFHGFDFDNAMLRIGSMNMLLHGVENPDIQYRDSLAQDHAGEEEKYTLVLANPPFAGSLDYENTAKDLLQIVKTKKTELPARAGRAVQFLGNRRVAEDTPGRSDHGCGRVNREQNSARLVARCRVVPMPVISREADFEQRACPVAREIAREAEPGDDRHRHDAAHLTPSNKSIVN